jgi:hypothetical protein
MRTAYSDLYDICAKLAARVYSKEFISDFLFGISVDGVDFVNGVVLLSFTHDDSGKKTRYQFAIHNEQAPYSKTWPDKLKECGAESHKAAMMFLLV